MPAHPGHSPSPKWLNLHLPAIPGNVRFEVGKHTIAYQPGKSGARRTYCGCYQSVRNHIINSSFADIHSYYQQEDYSPGHMVIIRGHEQSSTMG